MHAPPPTPSAIVHNLGVWSVDDVIAEGFEVSRGPIRETLSTRASRCREARSVRSAIVKNSTLDKNSEYKLGGVGKDGLADPTENCLF